MQGGKSVSDLMIGPYRLVDSRVVYDRTMMQLSAGAAVCANGDVVAYWNRHTDAIVGNEAHFMRSTDNARTWEMTGEPLSSEFEEGSVHVATGMAVLEDGSLLLPFADYQSGRMGPDDHPRRMKNRHRPGKLKLAVSTDHGHHWDRILEIATPFPFCYPFGRLFRCLDGALAMPVLVSMETCLSNQSERRGDGSGFFGSESWGTESGLLVSRDDGKTWGDWRVIVPAPNEQRCGECTIARCEDGSLLAMHRNMSPVWLASRSIDDGATWSAPEPTGLHGECGCLFGAPGGRLIAAYRSTRNAPPEVPVGLLMCVSEDSGRTWTPETPLPDPKGRPARASHETGMPDIVRLASGEVAVIWYSYDPDLPYGFPSNDTGWAGVGHFVKRYVAASILADSNV